VSRRLAIAVLLLGVLLAGGYAFFSRGDDDLRAGGPEHGSSGAIAPTAASAGAESGSSEPGPGRPSEESEALPAPGTLAGRVVEGGLAVARAEVFVGRRGDDPARADCQSGDTQVTGGGGTFATAPLCPGQYDVAARAAGKTAMRSVRLGPGERVELELTLQPEGTLDVVVTAPDGGAAKGARVQVTHSASGSLVQNETGEKGGVLFTPLPPGRWQVEVSHHDYFGATAVGDVRPGKVSTVRVRLDDALSLSGEVVDEGGLGLDGVRVALQLPAETGKVSSARVRATSADGGHFTLGPAPRGAYVVTAENEALRTPVKLPGPPVRLVIDRGTRLEVQLLDEGRKTPGLAVVSTRNDVQGAVSQDAGVIVFERVHRGEATVGGGRISFDDYRFHLSAEKKVRVEGKTQLVELEVSGEPGVEISGACRFTTGHRLPEVALHAAPASAMEFMGPGRKRQMTPELLSKLVGRLAFGGCKPDGGFALGGLVPGEYRLGAEASTAGEKANVEQKVTAPATGVDVVVPGVTWFRFRVVDPAGQPVTRFGFKPHKIESHEGGRFEEEHYKDEQMLVTIHAPGFQPAQRVATFRRGQDLDLGDLVLSRESAVVRGQVVDAVRRTPVAGAEVALGEAGSTLHATSTDGAGAFELGPIPRLDGELTASHPRYKPANTRFGAGDEAPLTVRLEPASWVKGRVLTRSGEVPAGLYAFAWSTATKESVWVEGGLFEIGPLEPGSYAISLGSDTQPGRTVDLSTFDVVQVELAAGEGREVELLERAGGTTFEVEQVDPTGDPVQSALHLVSGKPAGNTEALAEALRLTSIDGFAIAPGVFRFRAIPPGEWTLLCPSRSATQSVLVGPQLPPRLRFTVPAN
jgi:Carboxypeptidase regulatory-like domain